MKNDQKGKLRKIHKGYNISRVRELINIFQNVICIRNIWKGRVVVLSKCSSVEEKKMRRAKQEKSFLLSHILKERFKEEKTISLILITMFMTTIQDLLTPLHIPKHRKLNYLSHCSSGPQYETHLHTANQRPRVLICIQPIHRG